MAKMNVVNALGMVTSDPLIDLDENGNPKRANLFLSLASADRENGLSDSKIFYTTPFVYTEDPAIAAKMNTWKKNDIVLMTGAITTLDAKRGSICPHCGHKMQRDGEVSFVTPIFADVLYSNLEEKEALQILNDKREVSNRVYLMGTLCADVNARKESGIYRDVINQLPYHGVSAFQIAVGRKFYVKGDQPTNRTDFPHIISIGEHAKYDPMCIHKGSLVGVEGMLVTREFRRQRVCEKCSKEYEWPEKVLEVLTYGTEYLRDYITPEEAEKAEKEKFESEKNRIFES